MVQLAEVRSLAGEGGSTTISVQQDGTAVVPAADTVNFTGGVSVTPGPGSRANIDVSSGTAQLPPVIITGSLLIEDAEDANGVRNRVLRFTGTEGATVDVETSTLFSGGNFIEGINNGTGPLDFRALDSASGTNVIARADPGDSWTVIYQGGGGTTWVVAGRMYDPSTVVANASRDDDRIIFERKNGFGFSLEVSDLDRQLPVLGTAPGDITLTNINSRYIPFAAAQDGLITISANSDLNSGGVFLLDLSRVSGTRILELADTDASEFEDGSTSFNLPANSRYGFNCYLPNPLIPKSPTNKLIFRIGTFINANINSGIPRRNATVYLNPSNGFSTDVDSVGDSPSFPFSSLSDAFSVLSALPGAQHKQIIIEEENTLPLFNNDAVGGGNVANLRLRAEAVTLNGFRSIGHTCDAEVRRIDLNSDGDRCIISNGVKLHADVAIGLLDLNPIAEIVFDSTDDIDFFELKIETMREEIPLNFSGLNANAAGRIEINRYDGNITAALDTLPDVALNLNGWIENTIIQSSPNGTVYGITIANNGTRTVTAFNAPP